MHFGWSGDRGLPFSSASVPKSFQTAVTTSLINEIEISALPAAVHQTFSSTKLPRVLTECPFFLILC